MNKRFLVFGILLLLILLFCFLGFRFSSKELSSNDGNDSFDPDAWKYVGEKAYVEERDDGWFYYFLIVSENVNKENTNNFFSGCNLNNNELDDYNVIIYDENGNVENKIKAFPTLAISEKSKNGVMERDEVVLIDEFFDKKQFNRKIEVSDLDGLELNNFSKNEVVRLYNNSVDLEFKTSIHSFSLNECDLRSDENEDGFIVNIGVICIRHGIIAINIDLKYDDNTYLSDNISGDRELYENIQEIEKYIVDTQDINVEDNFDFEGEVYNRIYELLATFDDGWD